ncbi:hypothetical protein AB0I60_07710 [Actinosynnema sp. NPDC050436]|uniref:hypothetical protein n=1 Tax=Actinosynnema sp. NPDC050436 TaxID=3155659 RepID=UPI00340CB2B6
MAGLAERLAEVGGTVEAGPLDGGGYRLRAEVVRAGGAGGAVVRDGAAWGEVT